MKKLFIAVVLMVVSTAAFCQMFDGTIDGAIPGTMNDVSSHFIKKGYKFVNCPQCSNNIVFMEGKLAQPKGEKVDVLIYIQKDDDGFVYAISLYYPKEEQLALQYKIHRDVFANSFGKPSKSYVTKSKWEFGTYTYTIGVEEQLVYHTLKINRK